MSTHTGDTPLSSRLDLGSAHRLKLGLFGMNCSSGRSPVKGPHRWSGSWEDNLKAARIADAAGMDFLLPVARWKGYGGETDYQGATLETITWATALLAHTRTINVFATVHVPLVHPVLAAKQFVTADHVGAGRFGVNIVVGWNEDEFAMFGVEQREHDARYAYAQEWLDAINTLWTSTEPVDFDGKWLQLKALQGMPKPWGGTRPLLMNAAASPIGQSFALRNCDALFTSLNASADDAQMSQHVAAVKARAREAGRDLDLYTIGVVTCAPTMRQAQEYYREVVLEQADWGAVDALMRSREREQTPVTPEELDRMRRRYVGGSGGRQLIGDPDHIANECKRIADAGIRGLGFSFVNYAEELPYFCQEVLPRLERLGLRTAQPG